MWLPSTPPGSGGTPPSLISGAKARGENGGVPVVWRQSPTTAPGSLWTHLSEVVSSPTGPALPRDPKGVPVGSFSFASALKLGPTHLDHSSSSSTRPVRGYTALPQEEDSGLSGPHRTAGILLNTASPSRKAVPSKAPEEILTPDSKAQGDPLASPAIAHSDDAALAHPDDADIKSDAQTSSTVGVRKGLRGTVKRITSSKDQKAQDKLYFSSRAYSTCLLYTSPSPRDVEESRMPSSA